MKKLASQLFPLLALTAVCAAGQTPDSGKPASNTVAEAKANPPAASAPEKKLQEEAKSKKIWTNDDISQLKGVVSVVGTARVTEEQADDEEDNDKPQDNARQTALQRYREAIADLRGQIAVADARIAQLKDFKAENSATGNGLNPNRLTFGSPEEQVKQLEIKKKQLEEEIQDLEVQASKEGIDPGELR